MIVFFIVLLQAKNGIRYTSVTGFQTRALPISSGRVKYTDWHEVFPNGMPPTLIVDPSDAGTAITAFRTSSSTCHTATGGRSEERRVGKEYRAGMWTAECGRRHSQARATDLHFT